MHHFTTELKWTGNRGTGTSSYREYDRNYEVRAPAKASTVEGSGAKTFRGDAARYNPEELLIAALSSCHMLSYLHCCADAGVIVTAYEDSADGAMRLNADGSGEFVEVVLHPRVTIADESRRAEADALHEGAHEKCFIARSVNFTVRYEL